VIDPEADEVGQVAFSASWTTNLTSNRAGSSHGSAPTLWTSRRCASRATYFTSVPFAVVSGGLLCIAGVGILRLLAPGFARYDARGPVP
jgi:hypothetical protein